MTSEAPQDVAALRRKHVEKRTWDSGNSEAVDGWMTWCAGCGQRPWPCDTVGLLDQNDRLRSALRDTANALADELDGAFGIDPMRSLRIKTLSKAHAVLRGSGAEEAARNE